MKHWTFEKRKWFCFVLFFEKWECFFLSFLYKTLVAACGSWAPGRWRWGGRGCSRRSQPPAANHDDEDDDYDDDDEDEGGHEDDDQNGDGGGGNDDDADDESPPPAANLHRIYQSVMTNNDTHDDGVL